MWGEGVEEKADAFPGGFDGTLGGFAQEGLELGEEVLDRVEIGGVWGQEEELGAGGADGTADGLALVASQIIDDDDVARPEGGDENLLDIGEEASAVDRPVDDAWGLEAVTAQGGEEGECPPVAVRDLGDEALAAGAAAVGSGHVGLGPSLVDEDQARRIKPALIFLPLRPSPGDVGAILFSGVQAFF